MTNREEVAKKLREIDKNVNYDTALLEIDTIIGTEDSEYFSDFINRLADLIDPTCHMRETVEDERTVYVCSNCGSWKSEDKKILSLFNYCPVCGARVVSDDKG